MSSRTPIRDPQGLQNREIPDQVRDDIVWRYCMVSKLFWYYKQTRRSRRRTPSEAFSHERGAKNIVSCEALPSASISGCSVHQRLPSFICVHLRLQCPSAVAILRLHYSYCRLSTGFAVAAFIDCRLTVSHATKSTNKPATTNGNTVTSV